MIVDFKGITPQIDPSAWIAHSALVLGDVCIGAQSSVWYNSVVRGDVNRIRIGARSNIQDLSMVHVTRDLADLCIGDEVTIGHRVIVHGCKIGDRVMVGMGAVILDNAQIESDVIIGAGSLVLQGQQIPAGVLAVGHPAKVVRELTERDLQWLRLSAAHYVETSAEHAEIALPKS
ncbi:MAG: gamma carbonic anhydrase family protein [Candidatus Alcyoniella australis]|nr:gamma carbonic anhydrase family protein [Candidatus Alcyoniella australis]